MKLAYDTRFSDSNCFLLVTVSCCKIMEETEVRGHYRAITFVSNSSPAVEQIEMSATQDITTKPSVKKNKEKKLFSNSQDDTTTFCCCNISSKVAKCLELSGLVTGIVIVLMFSIPIINIYLLVSE